MSQTGMHSRGLAAVTALPDNQYQSLPGIDIMMLTALATPFSAVGTCFLISITFVTSPDKLISLGF